MIFGVYIQNHAWGMYHMFNLWNCFVVTNHDVVWLKVINGELVSMYEQTKEESYFLGYDYE